MKYEIDSEVPFWRSDVDVNALYENHKRPGAHELIAEQYCYDPDEPVELPDIALMTGRFLPLLSNETTYCFTFSPGLGEEKAIVFPIVEDGQMVDLLAVCSYDESLWGCVTGHGGMAGTFAAKSAVRVYKRPGEWILFYCDGVVVLRKDAYASNPFCINPDGSVGHVAPLVPKLAQCSAIYAVNLEHADELLYRLFEYPAVAFVHPTLSGHAFDLADRAIKKGEKIICIDPERCDIEAEILDHAVDDTILSLKVEGAFA